MNTPVVDAQNLQRTYQIKRGMFAAPDQLRAVGGVSFTVASGKTLAVVGESGCGKSTLARMVALIEKPTAGELRLSGIDAVNAPDEARKQLRQSVQMVFQNPYGSLNPRKKIGNILEAPLAINTTMSAAQRSEQGRAMMARVGLRPEHYQHIMRNVSHHPEVVRDEQICQPHLLLQVEQKIEHLSLNRYVECRNRFVGHQQPGLQHQRPGNGNPLPLAT